ncbi:hypothetical protein VNI00_016754 [Paramarasmius palmivorus]|uniref:Reverse transcriptase n=1 Tax=Paramarasmius palmivorus TaxID=297713 RepID=A0AAW0BAZ7_9AGAR
MERTNAGIYGSAPRQPSTAPRAGQGVPVQPYQYYMPAAPDRPPLRPANTGGVFRVLSATLRRASNTFFPQRDGQPVTDVPMGEQETQNDQTPNTEPATNVPTDVPMGEHQTQHGQTPNTEGARSTRVETVNEDVAQVLLGLRNELSKFHGEFNTFKNDIQKALPKAQGQGQARIKNTRAVDRMRREGWKRTESRILRGLISTLWLQQSIVMNQPTEQEITLYYHRVITSPVRIRRAPPSIYDLAAEREQVAVKFVHYSRSMSEAQKIWNLGMARWFVIKWLIPEVNRQIPWLPRDIRPRSALEAGDVEALAMKTIKHIQHVAQSRDRTNTAQKLAAAKDSEQRRRLLRRRMGEVSKRGMEGGKKALLALHIEGMSSTEDFVDPATGTKRQAVHRHPFRSAEATNFIRWVDDAMRWRETNAVNEVAGGSRAIFREVNRPDRATSRRARPEMELPQGWPENFYNWEAIQEAKGMTKEELMAALSVVDAQPDWLRVQAF